MGKGKTKGERKDPHQKGRSPHPGVIIVRLQRQTGETYLARWKDPASGKSRQESLTALGLTTESARRDWAIGQSKRLAQLRQKRAAGGRPVRDPGTIQEEGEQFLAGYRESSPRTAGSYEESMRVFLDWAAEAGVRNMTDLTGPLLWEFSDYVFKRRKRIAKPGGKQGETLETATARSKASCNKDLRQVRVFLNQCRKRGLLPFVNREEISDALEARRQPRTKTEFLYQRQLRLLLEASLRHDSATFDMTREEHDGKRPVGSTPRYDPVSPFLLAVLLTGCRAGEIRELEWTEVAFDLERFEILASKCKTRESREVSLRESPSLLTLLRGLKVRAGDGSFVFGGAAPLSEDRARKTLLRLRNQFGAPPFTWQILRQTCSTYLVNAHGIYEGASAWHAAKRLGHSVTVMEKHYAGVLSDIPRTATTLEAAMGIEDLAEKIVSRAVGVVDTGRERAKGGA